jgi:hypothetical protein
VDQRSRILTDQRQRHRLVEVEIEAHVQLVAALVAEELSHALVFQVDLAHQQGVAAPPPDEAAQVAQPGVRLHVHRVADAVDLQQKRHRIDAKTGKSEFEPEADDPADFLAHLRVGDVEVRLVLVEAMQVVLPGRLVPCPDAVFLVREDETCGVGLRRLVAPDVPVAER